MQVSALRRKLFLHGFRLWIAIAVLAYTLAGFLLAPWIVHRQLETRVADLLGHTISVDAVRVNPYTLTLSVRGLTLDMEGEEKAAGFGELFVNFELASLWKRAFTFAEFRLTDPWLDFLRTADGNTLGRLVPAPGHEAAADAEADDGGPPRLIVRRFLVESGRLGFRDDTRPEGFSSEIRPIDLTLENLSTLPGLDASERLVAETASGGRVVLTGEHSLFPVRASGRLEYRENLAVFWRYFRDRLGFRLADGSAELAFDYSVDLSGDDPAISASKLSLEITDTSLVPPGSDEEFFGAARLAIADGRLAWPEKSVSVGSVSVDEPRASAVMGEDGVLDILEYLRPSGGLPEAEAALAAAAETIEESTAVPDEQSPWSVQLARLTLGDGRVDFEDRRRSPAFRSGIAALEIDASDLRLEPGSTGPLNVAFDVQTGGRVEFTGKLGLSPLSFALDTDVANVALVPAQPYVGALARLTLDNGSVSAAGKLGFGAESGLTYDGSATLENFSARDTLSGERFFAVGSARADGLDFAQRPGAVNIDKVTLSAPFFRIFIAGDGSTNIGAVLKADNGEPAAAETADDTTEEKTAEPFRFSVGTTEIADGTANFADNSLPIPFATGIYELGGSIGTIASGIVSPASIELEGRVDEYGSVAVAGELDLLSPAARSELDVDFRNVAMPRLSPYTAKFAGRRIAGGSLDLSLSYRIRDGVLDASNDIVIDQLELGERVESPDALDLPLGLAIALLKDSQGRISVDIPVSGDLGDPSFSIGGVVGKALRNLLVSVVAAPFKILAALVGGSADELDHVMFAAGGANLSPPARETLEKLAEAMTRRPQLVLELAGVYAADADRQAIQAARLNAAVTAEVEALIEDDSVPVAMRRNRALENLFVERFTELRLDELRSAFTRQATDAEAEGGQPGDRLDTASFYGALRNQLRQTFEVGSDELETLARGRASAIAAFLSEQSGIEPDRLRVRDIARVDGEDSSVRLSFELAAAGR